MGFIGAGIIVLAVFLFYASYSIRAGIYVRACCRGKVRRKVAALTFDDGPDGTYTPKVLDLLEKQGLKACFFCIGDRAAAHPELVERMVREGHLVGNHSMHHRWWFPWLPVRYMSRELRQTRELLEKRTGQKNDLFRPPFGVTNPTVARTVRRLHYQVIGWSIRSLDTGSRNTERIVRRIRRQLHPGAVILLHDRLPWCPEVLEKLLIVLKEEGYEVVRVDEYFKFAVD